MSEEMAELAGIPLNAPHLLQALTHPSYANESDDPDNQRLEFLGDAVLELCSSELLCERFPDAAEGELTRMRARVVNADALADWGRANGVCDALRLGRGADAGGLRTRTNVVADAVEALIAAAYLDGGLETARVLCQRIVEPMLAELAAQSKDPKSELQERVQGAGGRAPTYEVVARGGPAHDPWFEVSVRIADADAARGRGRSKQKAERAAASAALAGDGWRELLEREEHEGEAE